VAAISSHPAFKRFPSRRESERSLRVLSTFKRFPVVVVKAQEVRELFPLGKALKTFSRVLYKKRDAAARLID
jgi:hypothetical protein